MNINTLPSLSLHYELVKKIGEGGNSTVWSVKNKDDVYACKIPLDNDLNQDIIDEATTMSLISKYPNPSKFLTFYGIYEHNGLAVMISELFAGDLLSNLRINKVNLSIKQIIFIAKSILEQLLFLHEKNLNHGDLHDNNILFNPRRVVLIDVTNQKYYPDTSNNIEAEVTRTLPQYYIKAINSGISPVSLYQKKDIFEFGETIRGLMGYDDLPPWHEFIQNPEIYKINSQNLGLDILINSAMNIDITQRPTANDLLYQIIKLSF